MEMEKVPQAGYAIKGIDIAGFNRSSLISNIGLPFKLVKSYFQVRSMVADFMPDAVVGVGGYSSFPVLRFAQHKGIPTCIHESNSFAGKSNKMLGVKATKIFVATDGMEKFFPAAKIMVTGNPVRSNIVNSRVTRTEAIHFFGLDENKKTVLVTGGSLGAKGINEAIDAGIDAFARHDIQLVWQTGKPYAARAREITAGDAATKIFSMNNTFEVNYDAVQVVSPAGVSTIDDQNILTTVNGNTFQGTAFNNFAGGVSQQGTAGNHGTFGSAGTAEFNLDLYRMLARATGGSPIANQVDGPLRSGSYEGTFTINSGGSVSFQAISAVPEPSGALALGLIGTVAGLGYRRRRSA